ncbi:phosphotransferase [Rhizobium laguerreae]|uniref:phosphotransferase n=1 Tax=Rhizobium laguerreae TaxID=1076926 RepID=UPI001C90F78E|nr:phosphotransferase [Rhizobium laguerreae]MBY3246179.1 phosphotransferase [Rhizobium laguerreae]MBY3252743.1 phosphotransferase [Rhizobium laguerreae]
MSLKMDHKHQCGPARAAELSEACHPVDATEAEAIAERLYGTRGSATRFETEKDDTFLLDCAAQGKFVLKIAHPLERVEELDFQVALMRHLEQRAPDLPIPRTLRDVDGADLPIVTTSAGERRVVRLMTFMVGTPLDRTSCTAPQRERIGEILAKLRHSMADFSHPADGRAVAWDVTHLLDLSDLLSFIPRGGKRAWTVSALERFAEIKPELDRCRRQVLHNDFNTSNLVVDHASPRFLTGVIDFGDAVRTAIAVDVSTALMNQMPKTFDHGNRADLFEAPRDVLRGYLRHAELTDDELRLIPFLSMGRLAVRALLTSWRAEVFPENSRYILRNTEAGWAHLEWFHSISTAHISDLLTR